MLFEFNENQKHERIRLLYKNNFERIKGLILKFGDKPSLEDIASIDPELENHINNNMLFLKEINRGIANNTITFNNIK